MDHEAFSTRDVLSSLRRGLRARAFGRLAVLGALAAGLLVGLGMGLDFLFMWTAESRLAYAAVAAAAFAAGMGGALWRPITAPLSDMDLVFLIEERLPELDERLATAFQMWEGASGVGSDGARERLRRALVESDLAADAGRYGRIFSRRALAAPVLACAALGAGFFVLAVTSPLFRTGLARWMPGSGARWTRLALDPVPSVVGESEPVLVSGTVSGRVPSEVFLRIDGEGAAPVPVRRVPVADGSFRHLVEGMNVSFRIVVEAGDDASGPHAVRVLRKPSILSVRVELVPPAYTRKPSAVQDHGDITALVGTRVRFSCRADRPLASGQIALSGGARVPMTPDADGLGASGEFTVSDTENAYSAVLTGTDGLANDPPPQYRIRAVPDRPPVVEWVRPARTEVKAVAGAALRFSARLTDDTRVTRAVLAARKLPEGERREAPLSLDGLPEVPVGIALASLDVREGDLVACTVEAADEREPTPNLTSSRPLRIRVVSAAEMVSEIDALISRAREAADEAYEKWLLADLVLDGAARAGILGGADQATVAARQREAARNTQASLEGTLETLLRVEENALADQYPPALFAAIREGLSVLARDAIPAAMRESPVAARKAASEGVLARLAAVRTLFLEWEDFSGIVRLTGRSVRAQEEVIELLEGKRPGRPDR